MTQIQSFCEKFNINLFLKNGDGERFENVIDINLNGYYATILTLEGTSIIESSKINSIHIFTKNREFDRMLDIWKERILWLTWEKRGLIFMEFFRDLLLIILAFLAGANLGQISGYKNAFKDFNIFLKGFMNNEEKESKENWEACF